MKKSVLIFALAGFFGVASFATETKGLDNDPLKTQTEVQEGKQDVIVVERYEEISVDNVPEAVQKAALQDNRDAVIESAEEKVLANGEKVYKLKINSAATGEETKSFYANGREYSEENR
jgi:hypothetical protein